MQSRRTAPIRQVLYDRAPVHSWAYCIPLATAASLCIAALLVIPHISCLWFTNSSRHLRWSAVDRPDSLHSPELQDLRIWNFHLADSSWNAVDYASSLGRLRYTHRTPCPFCFLRSSSSFASTSTTEFAGHLRGSVGRMKNLGLALCYL